MAQKSLRVPHSDLGQKFMDRITNLEVKKLGQPAAGESYFVGELAQGPILSKSGLENP